MVDAEEAPPSFAPWLRAHGDAARVNFVEVVKPNPTLPVVVRPRCGPRQAALEDQPAPTCADGSTGCPALLHAKPNRGFEPQQRDRCAKMGLLEPGARRHERSTFERQTIEDVDVDSAEDRLGRCISFEPEDKRGLFRGPFLRTPSLRCLRGQRSREVVESLHRSKDEVCVMLYCIDDVGVASALSAKQRDGMKLLLDDSQMTSPSCANRRSRLASGTRRQRRMLCCVPRRS